MRGEDDVKGRTTCPQCNQEFMVDVPDTEERNTVTCPHCNHTFTIKTKGSKNKENEECSWEEHGEPRKTILSALKTKTGKPTIAAILLIAVFVIGTFTAFFAEPFIESSLETLSGIGVKGSVEFTVINTTNASLPYVNVTINGVQQKTNEVGFFSSNNVSLGVQTITFSYPGYDSIEYEMLVTPILSPSHKIHMSKGTGKEERQFNSIGCSTIFMIFAVFALLGAVSVYQRRNFDVAVAGSLIGALSFGFFYIGSILAIVAFFIILKCKEEFNNGKKGKVF